MYTEIIKIIEGGMVNDKEKVFRLYEKARKWKRPR